MYACWYKQEVPIHGSATCVSFLHVYVLPVCLFMYKQISGVFLNGKTTDNLLKAVTKEAFHVKI